MNTRLFLTVSILATTPGFGLALQGEDFTPPHDFQAGSPARASEVNENFQSMSAGLTSLSSRIDAFENTVPPANVRIVATEGGDFDSVAAALASITDAADDNRYLVRVAPGVYDETEASVVPSFVVLRGAGPEVTVVRSQRSSNVPNVTAATAQLQDFAGIADLTIVNTGASSLSIGVSVIQTSRNATLRNVRILLDGAGGTGHFGVHASDSDLTIEGCRIEVSGATIANSAFACVDSNGPFSQPLVQDSILIGRGNNTGMGMQLSETAATVMNSRVRGDFRAINSTINGISRIHHSQIETLGASPVYEVNGGAAILSAGVNFVGGNPVGLATQFRYVHCYKANFQPVVNGDGSDID